MTKNQRGQQRGKIIDDFPNCFQGRGAPKPGSNGLKVEDTKVKQELRLLLSVYQQATEMVDHL